MLLVAALTLVVGQPGVGKTMLLHTLAYCVCTGNPFFGRDVEVRGNVLGLFGEETSNESDIRWAACAQKLGKNDGKYKLFKRGWSGINIDLDPQTTDIFNHFRPKDENICAAVSDLARKKIIFSS